MRAAVESQIEAPVEVRRKLDDAKTMLVSLENEFEGFTNGLTEFFKKLDGEDQSWFRWHDRGLVIAACLIALFFAVWRVWDGPSLDTTLTWLNAPAEVPGCIPVD